MDMYLNNIIPTHNRLRNPTIIPILLDKFKDDEFWMINNPVYLSKIENEIYLHDAHHRLLAASIFGKIKLTQREYRIKEFTYEQYNLVNRKLDYLTPFDPRIECRIPHFWPLKSKLRQMSDEEIFNNKHLYVENRRVYKIDEIEYV